MEMTDGRIDEAYARLRKLGLRLTPQRMAIAKCVLDTDAHPTAEDVYLKIRPGYPTISLATVYSTLDTLARAGVVQAVSTRQVVRYDSHASRHINLICLNCSKIIDVDDGVIAGVAKKKAGEYRFRIVDQQYMVYGYCQDCRAEVP
jgi:Fur family peroxide stress response transcriptional regulator